MPIFKDLDDYRHAIAHAGDGRNVELLIYRALPLLYESMGLPYDEHGHAAVAANLRRGESQWELWFNIEIPHALSVLAHLAPALFKNMSGGKHQASAIVKGSYGDVVASTVAPFALEEVFQERQRADEKRLNAAVSLDAWWRIFDEQLPWSLARARGWTEPTAKQWDAATSMAESFGQKYATHLRTLLIVSGHLKSNEGAQISTRWSDGAKNFTNRIDRAFYPLLSHQSWLQLDSGAVHSFNISNMHTENLTAGLRERAQAIVWAYCQVSGSKNMPAYLLRPAISEEFCMETYAMVDGMKAAPSTF